LGGVILRPTVIIQGGKGGIVSTDVETDNQPIAFAYGLLGMLNAKFQITLNITAAKAG
jgi:hypothetical protein